jgi:hypothetical protein
MNVVFREIANSVSKKNAVLRPVRKNSPVKPTDALMPFTVRRSVHIGWE